MQYTIKSKDILNHNSYNKSVNHEEYSGVYCVFRMIKIDVVQKTQRSINLQLLKNREFLILSSEKAKIGESNIALIFQEWGLWSKCYGKVLVINGVSSSGKTTLSSAFKKFGFYYINVDNIVTELLYYETTRVLPFIQDAELLAKSDIIHIISGTLLDEKHYTRNQLQQIKIINQRLTLLDKSSLQNIGELVSYQKITEKTFEETRKYITNGVDVVIDIVLMPEDIDIYLRFSSQYNPKMVLLYTPLELNLANCFSRPLDDFRYPTQIISQFMRIYKFHSHGNQGISIDREKILNALEYSKSHLKEKFSFLCEAKYLELQKNTEDAIYKVQRELISSREVYISVHLVHDLAITIPQANIIDELLIFLINFIHQRDFNLDQPNILPNFIAFHAKKSVFIKCDSSHTVHSSIVDHNNLFLLEHTAHNKHITTLQVIDSPNNLATQNICTIQAKVNPSEVSQRTYTQVFANKIYGAIEGYLKRVIYNEDIQRFKAILQNNGIVKTIDVLQNLHDFKLSILLKLHPDKGGNNEDFIFVKSLQEKFSKTLDLQELINNKVKTTLPFLHNTAIGFKIFDTIVDSVRLTYEPTFYHIKKIALDSTYIYSMCSGVDNFFLVLNGADVIYQTYYGEYNLAFKTIVVTLCSITLSKALAANTPYLSFAYGAIITTYIGYNAVTNFYSLYQYIHTESVLRLVLAYKDFSQALSESPLQIIYDFTTLTKHYALQANKFLLLEEKAAIKTKLLEEKGKFGQKLYDYIYSPYLEEKYSILSKVIKGILKVDEAESLKARHIKIISHDQFYEHCMEIKNIETDNNNNEHNNKAISEISKAHYYCYNYENQRLDHIVIGYLNDIKIIEHL